MLLTRHRDPHNQYVIQTADAIARTLRAGQLICLESTTYPSNTHFSLTTIPKVFGEMSGTCIDSFYLP
jgi:UDP-N-acetyl-D-glucosamine dehydrogenase